jgi:hypothetical protein
VVVVVGLGGPGAVGVRGVPLGDALGLVGGGVLGGIGGCLGALGLDVLHLVVARAADEQVGGGHCVHVVRLGHALVHGVVALVAVHVAGEVHVDAVLVEQVLHRRLEVSVDGVSLVHGVVARSEDPRAHIALLVGLDEVVLQPGELVAEASAGQHVAGLLCGAGVAGLSVDRDEVRVAEVEGVVHVEHAAALRGGHAEAVVVGGEVRQLLSFVLTGQAVGIVAIYNNSNRKVKERKNITTIGKSYTLLLQVEHKLAYQEELQFLFYLKNLKNYRFVPAS